MFANVVVEDSTDGDPVDDTTIDQFSLRMVRTRPYGAVVGVSERPCRVECEPYCLAGELDCAAGYKCTGDRCEVDDDAPFCGAGCGRYACIGFLGRCATHCADDADCAPEATCTSGVCG